MKAPSAAMSRRRVPRARRLFSVVYDSVRQRDFVAARVGQRGQAGLELSLQANLHGRLRLDAILSGQVVVTDAQVLDGPLFAAVTPAEVSAALGFLPGPAAQLVVRARGGDLHGSVLGLVTDADTGTIKPFLFSLIADDVEQAKVDHYLHGLRGRGQRAPTELGELEAHLRRAGLDEHWLTVMRSHWSTWTASAVGSDQDGAAIAVEPFRPGRPDLAHAVALADLDGDRPDQLVDGLSPIGAGLVIEVREAMIAGRPLRTDLYRSVDAAFGTGESVAAALESLMIKQYVDKIFGLAFREQHGCEDFDSIGLIPAQPIAAGVGQRADPRLLEQLEREMLCDIGIPSDFLARLAFAGSEDLEDWAEEYADDLVRWRGEEDTGGSLRRALGGLEELLATVVPPQRVARRLGMALPPGRRRAGIMQLVRRHGGDVAGIASPEFGTLASVVRLIVGGGTAAGRFLLGNPAIITTDVALPRRDGGRHG